MPALRIEVALVLAAMTAAALALASAAMGQGMPALPDCPSGTAPLTPPTPRVEGSPRFPDRVIAGRPFTIEYDTTLGVAVQDTLGPPGTTFDGDDPTGGLVTPTVPAPGPAAFTVRYYALSGTPACVQSTTFTVDVELGDPLPARIGAAEGPTRFIARLPRLPRVGILTTGAPVAGLLWPCTVATALVPVVAELRVERNLRRRPSASSPLTTLTLTDPCGADAFVPGPVASLRHRLVFDDTRGLVVEHRWKKGARYWLRITQAGRLLGELRYYVAFRAARGRFAQTWVIAPEAAFERARCRRPPPSTPLGFRTFPLPPCPR